MLRQTRHNSFAQPRPIIRSSIQHDAPRDGHPKRHVLLTKVMRHIHPSILRERRHRHLHTMSKALMCALQGGRTRGQDLLAGRGDAEGAAAGKGTEVEAVPGLSEYDREGFGLSAYDLFEVPRRVLLPLRAVVESVSKPMFEGLLMSCDISTGFRFGLYAYVIDAGLIWNG